MSRKIRDGARNVTACGPVSPPHGLDLFFPRWGEPTRQTLFAQSSTGSKAITLSVISPEKIRVHTSVNCHNRE